MNIDHTVNNSGDGCNWVAVSSGAKRGVCTICDAFFLGGGGVSTYTSESI